MAERVRFKVKPLDVIPPAEEKSSSAWLKLQRMVRREAKKPGSQPKEHIRQDNQGLEAEVRQQIWKMTRMQPEDWIQASQVVHDLLQILRRVST